MFRPSHYDTTLYDACSPGPESFCFRFFYNPADNYVDLRGGRQVLHAMGWAFAGLWLIENSEVSNYEQTTHKQAYWISKKDEDNA